MITWQQLQKGDRISPDVLEVEFNAKQETPKYRLALMTLINKIQDESDQAGQPLLCKTEKEYLVILTDTEALIYKAEQHDIASYKIYRNARHLNRIDPNNLSKRKEALLEKEVLLQSHVAQAVRRERRILGVRPHRT